MLGEKGPHDFSHFRIDGRAAVAIEINTFGLHQKTSKSPLPPSFDKLKMVSLVEPFSEEEMLIGKAGKERILRT